MASEHIIPFPCSRSDTTTCLQEARICVLETRTSNGKSQMDRIEDKLDQVRNWLLGAVLSVAIALVAIVVTLLRR